MDLEFQVNKDQDFIFLVWKFIEVFEYVLDVCEEDFFVSKQRIFGDNFVSLVMLCNEQV